MFLFLVAMPFVTSSVPLYVLYKLLKLPGGYLQACIFTNKTKMDKVIFQVAQHPIFHPIYLMQRNLSGLIGLNSLVVG